ncbi:MAG: hypothetical protein Q4G68_05070 [Planctomycetia bacterium]|nr:hypothetical protein [Planctomycetia bacterium]
MSVVRIRLRSLLPLSLVLACLVFAPLSVSGQTEDIFSDHEVTDPFAPSTLPPLKENPMPVVDHQEQSVLFERLEDKDPSTLTEEEFYKTITAAESAVLTPQPTSGPDLFVAGAMIARVGRPHFAKFFLEKSMTAEGTPVDFANAVNKLGSERVFFLVNHPVLKELGSQAADHALEQANLYWQSDEFLSDALRRSEIGTQESRAAGLLDLRKGGVKAISYLLREMAGSDASRRESLLASLRFLGAGAVDSLLLHIKSRDANQVSAALDVLAGMSDVRIGEELLVKYYDGSCPEAIRNGALKQALERQWQTIPSREEAFRIAQEKALAYYNRKAVLPVVLEGLCYLPVWNEETQAVEQISLGAGACYRRESARWSLAALDIALGDSHLDRGLICPLAMTAVAEDLYFQNLDKPLDTSLYTQVFPEATVSQLLAALRYAMDTRHEKGGIYPVVLLGRMGDETLCVGDKGDSCFVQATYSRDRRLRFAALSALARIKPSHSFSGSSRAQASLMACLNSRGAKKAIVASPKLDEALKAGNWLAELGYSIVPATTGADVIRLSQSDADIELVVMADAIRQPDPATVIQTLQNDYRTADIPVVFGAGDEAVVPASLGDIETEPNAVWSFLPYDRASANWTLERLFEKTDLAPVPAEVRLAQAKGAAFLLTSLRSECPGVFEPEDLEVVVRQLIGSPLLVEQGLALAMTIPGSGIQNHLANLVGDVRLEQEQRRRFLTAFGEHLEKYGSMLRGPDIVRIYDRYNSSEKEDQQTQQILSDLLDALEKYTKEKS